MQIIHHENSGPRVRRSLTVLTTGITLSFLTLIGMGSLNPDSAKATGPYELRVCSPTYFTDQGARQTHNPNLEPGWTRVWTYNGFGVQYPASISGQTVANMKTECNTPNTSKAGIQDFGFTLPGGQQYAGNESGIEIMAPFGQYIRQIDFMGRHLLTGDPGPLPGIHGTELHMKLDFVYPQGETHTTTNISNLMINSVPLGANAPQTSTAVRIGLRCVPKPGRSECLGGYMPYPLVRLNDIVLTLQDSEPVAVTVAGNPFTNGQWVKGNQSVPFTLTDPAAGTGVRQSQVYIDDELVSEKLYGCDLVSGEFGRFFTGAMARNAHPCPSTVNETVTVNTTQIADGRHTLKVCSRDFASWTPFWKGEGGGPPDCSVPRTVRIDNHTPLPPEIGGTAFINGQWVDGNQEVKITAKDTTFGIRETEILVDGIRVWSRDYQCDLDNIPCPKTPSETPTIDTGTLGDGEHILTACSKDFATWEAGGPASCTPAITIRVDNKLPGTPEVTGDLFTDGKWVKGTRPVTVKATGSSASGVRQIEVFLDQARAFTTVFPCEPGGTPCPQETIEEVNFDTSRFADGIHTLKACVKNFVAWREQKDGRCSKGIEVRFDNHAPAAPESLEAVKTTIPKAVAPNDLTWANPGKAKIEAGDDAGSPIHELRYEVLDSKGNVVVPTVDYNNGSDSKHPADDALAENVVALPDLNTPLAAGEYQLRMRLVDGVGLESKASTVPLSYACENTGGTPQPDIVAGLGLVEKGRPDTQAASFLALDQGEGSRVIGKVRGSGKAPLAGADVCVNAKPVTDPKLELLSSLTTTVNGNFTGPLRAGPSRNLVAVVRQGHRESWSDPVATEVTVAPTLSTQLKGAAKNYRARQSKLRIRSGTRLWFKGQIPGPHSDRVVVVMTGKPAGRKFKQWRAFRRYRTRYGGRFKVPNRFYNTGSRPARLKIRAQVRNQVGYPYAEGNSQIMTLIILPKKRR